mmetsp:Transcript_4054/g.8598  ORF Transcript_4054/g.8598 Transcript_4054/m.8598 type:complete len:208 (-) Transcript_4054:162-785(-)
MAESDISITLPILKRTKVIPCIKTAFNCCNCKKSPEFCKVLLDNSVPLIISANFSKSSRQSKLGRAMEEIQRLQTIYLPTPSPVPVATAHMITGEWIIYGHSFLGAQHHFFAAGCHWFSAKCTRFLHHDSLDAGLLFLRHPLGVDIGDDPFVFHGTAEANHLTTTFHIPRVVRRSNHGKEAEGTFLFGRGRGEKVGGIQLVLDTCRE